MKTGFALRELRVTGRGAQDAVVTFSDGRNVIAGPSDTGKTYVETGAIQTGPDGKRLLLGSLRKLELALTEMTDAAWNKQGVLVAGASGNAEIRSRVIGSSLTKVGG